MLKQILLVAAIATAAVPVVTLADGAPIMLDGAYKSSGVVGKESSLMTITYPPADLAELNLLEMGCKELDAVALKFLAGIEKNRKEVMAHTTVARWTYDASLIFGLPAQAMHYVRGRKSAGVYEARAEWTVGYLVIDGIQRRRCPSSTPSTARQFKARMPNELLSLLGYDPDSEEIRWAKLAEQVLSRHGYVMPEGGGRSIEVERRKPPKPAPVAPTPSKPEERMADYASGLTGWN